MYSEFSWVSERIRRRRKKGGGRFGVGKVRRQQKIEVPFAKLIGGSRLDCVPHGCSGSSR